MTKLNSFACAALSVMFFAPSLLAADEVVTTTSYIARGATFALAKATVAKDKQSQIKELGICWATTPDPTIDDNKLNETTNLKDHSTDYGDFFYIKDLTPATIYYMRAYGVDEAGNVEYGKSVKVVTVPKGQITYSINYNDADDATKERLAYAVEHAVEMWNNATSINGFHVTVNYVPGAGAGDGTADCSYGGWMRVSQNASYQRPGTILHEMNHGVGVGQHEIWYGPNSPYRETGSSGTWKGQRANKLIRFLTSSKTLQLKGDGTHMWPFGINGAHEDTNNDLIYLVNGLVTQAVGEDALPPVANRFHTPSYTFDYQDDVKYYIKPEKQAYGAYSNFIIENEDGEVVSVPMTCAEAAADDHAAWYIEFTPEDQFYRFKNAATGNYMHRKSTVSIDCVADITSSPDQVAFQLTPGISNIKVDGQTLTTYQLSGKIQSSAPRTLSINPSTKALVLAGYNCMTPATFERQRFAIFDSEMLPHYEAVEESAVEGIYTDSDYTLFPADIYDIAGRKVMSDAESIDGLAPGIYIVNGKKILKK